MRGEYERYTFAAPKIPPLSASRLAPDCSAADWACVAERGMAWDEEVGGAGGVGMGMGMASGRAWDRSYPHLVSMVWGETWEWLGCVIR